MLAGTLCGSVHKNCPVRLECIGPQQNLGGHRFGSIARFTSIVALQDADVLGTNGNGIGRTNAARLWYQRRTLPGGHRSIGVLLVSHTNGISAAKSFGHYAVVSLVHGQSSALVDSGSIVRRPFTQPFPATSVGQ